MTDEPVDTPAQLVAEGQSITVKIAGVDLRRHVRKLSAADGAGAPD
ncbi:hypothetical protein [Streptomyces sp. NPDC002825]